MNRRTIALSVSLLAATTLAGCGSAAHTEQISFPWEGTTLEVTNTNANMPVSVRAGTTSEVKVKVSTTSAGKRATTPAWTLNGNSLDVGTPCGKGYIGVCEGSYTITVPTGTTVKVNGTETPAR